MNKEILNHLKENNKIGKYVLSMDCETTGSTMKSFEESAIEYQAISFSFVVFDYETLKDVDALHVIIAYDASKYSWSMEAQRIHGLTKEFTLTNGCSGDEAAEKIVNFLIKWFDYKGAIHVTGHNVEFDIAFLKQILDPHGLMFKVGKKFDTSTVAGISIGVTYSEPLYQFLGLPPRAEHNSLEDAYYNLLVWRKLRCLSLNTSFD